MNTTNTKETIEPKEKQKATQFLGDLDLRDYFAAKAMQGMFAADTDSSVIPPAKKAQYAYEAADAMLEARDK